MGILEIILVIILIMWLAGLGFGVAGNLIHLLLVLFVIVLIVRLAQGRRIL